MAELHPEYCIHIDKVIAKKFPGKKFPKWFISWIKNFIHEDFLNDFFIKGYEGIEFCTECTKALDIHLDVQGLERVKVPEGAKITFASNHPLGGIDGVALSLPAIVGAGGVEIPVPAELSDEELSALKKSGETLKAILDENL